MLMWGLAAVACAVLGVLLGLVSLIVAFWDTHRMAALLGVTAVFVIMAVVCGSIGMRVFQGRRRLLEGTMQQLEHDHHRARGGRP
jgi:uncharacterized membrane protein YqjE